MTKKKKNDGKRRLSAVSSSRKKQTRRSISVRGSTYTILSQFCARNDMGVSTFIEELVDSFFKSNSSLKPFKPLNKEELVNASKIFTF